MIQLQNLHITVPGFEVRDVDLTIPDGEFFALLGPTGSGKTLVLESIAGLMKPSRGRVLVNGHDMTRLPPELRGISLVYQGDALFPHLSVMENIRFGLRYQSRQVQEESGPVVENLVSMLGLDRLVDRKPSHLSGGEKQRVSLARALAVKPSVLLLDEPLSALDPNFREDIRKVLKELHKELGVTFVMVTHDFTEALFLADKIAIIHKGTMQQVGAPEEVFQRPETPFVAGFVGMKNLLPCQFSGRQAVCGELNLTLNQSSLSWHSHLAVRPEDISVRLQDNFREEVQVFPGIVQSIVNNGFQFEAEIDCLGQSFTASISKRRVFSNSMGPGTRVYLGFDPNLLHTL